MKSDILFKTKEVKCLKNFINKFKVSTKGYLTTNVLFITFVITSVLNATLLRFFTVKNYFDFKPVIADLAVVVIIGAFGYFIKPKLVEDEVLISSAFRRRRMFEVVIKYIAPVFIVLILVSSLLDALGIMTI